MSIEQKNILPFEKFRLPKEKQFEGPLTFWQKMPSIPSPPFEKSHEPNHPQPQLTAIPTYPHLPLHSSIVASYLESELLISRLTAIFPHLWVAGRKGHVRPLHKQIMLGRSLFITEDPAMHLVWFENSLFLKPIPEALLSWDFWARFISIHPNHENRVAGPQRGPLYETACGFMLSYTKLIVHPSDYRIAVMHNLMPDMGFHTWCLLAQDIKETCSKPDFVTEKRWEYGELRLSRLNWIYKLTLRGYSYFYIFTEYSPYFGKNFQLLLLCFAYCSVVLAAMQVVMTSKEPTEWLVNISIRFSVMVILFVFLVVCALVGLFCSLFWYHFARTVFHQRKFRGKKHIA